MSLDHISGIANQIIQSTNIQNDLNDLGTALSNISPSITLPNSITQYRSELQNALTATQQLGVTIETIINNMIDVINAQQTQINTMNSEIQQLQNKTSSSSTSTSPVANSNPIKVANTATATTTNNNSTNTSKLNTTNTTVKNSVNNTATATNVKINNTTTTTNTATITDSKVISTNNTAINTTSLSALIENTNKNNTTTVVNKSTGLTQALNSVLIRSITG